MEKNCAIDNGIYNRLGERWYTADDDPIALLRAESKLKGPWVAAQLRDAGFLPNADVKILDIGCGAGFLTNYLAGLGYSLTGVDVSEESLRVAQLYDKTQSAQYVEADAYSLPFEDGSFSCVAAMDFLEHVTDPLRVICEAARVLKPGGLFVFHTFNRNPLSYFFVIKCVEWLVPNTPPNMHIYNMFITPRELKRYCLQVGLTPKTVLGIKPKFATRAFWKGVFTRRVPEDFSFELTGMTLLSYMGYAIKEAEI